MKESHTETNGAKPSQWQRTQYSNLIRYIPSGTYFARVRVGGKLIRKNEFPFREIYDLSKQNEIGWTATIPPRQSGKREVIFLAVEQFRISIFARNLYAFRK
jgi:hypothetical protein